LANKILINVIRKLRETILMKKSLLHIVKNNNHTYFSLKETSLTLTKIDIE